MNRSSYSVAFVAVLFLERFCIFTSTETLAPLKCSGSTAMNCDAFLYVCNITESIGALASRLNIPASDITLFSGSGFLAKVKCSCLSISGMTAYFYVITYTVRPSDVGIGTREISDKYFNHLGWTEMQRSDYKVGEQIQLGLGCGCPIPGWQSIISYAAKPQDTLRGIAAKFNSSIGRISSFNNITDLNLIRANTVYFVPFQKDINADSKALDKSPAWSPAHSPTIDNGIPKKHRVKAKRALHIAVALVGVPVLLLVSVLVVYYGFCRRASSQTLAASTTADVCLVRRRRMVENLIASGRKQQGGESMCRLSVATITNLTEDEIIQMKSYCNHYYEIGEGGYGQVYMGNLKNREVAIKKIKCRLKDGRKFVENKVRLLEGKTHRNLIALLGWCIEERMYYLVYEYIHGCTLHDYLRENHQGMSLSWKECLRIIVGIAEGIEFLHSNKIIHVDIKPQNIMLDSKDDDVKIIDFGFSRHVDWDGTHISTERVAGTRGYWAPEYCLKHNLSYKHDVYSFGIVVLEMITGQMHVNMLRGSSEFHIPEYVKHMIAQNRFEEVVDDRLKDGWDIRDARNAMAVAELALKCADDDKNKRPYMDCVVRVLKSLNKDDNREESSKNSGIDNPG